MSNPPDTNLSNFEGNSNKNEEILSTSPIGFEERDIEGSLTLNQTAIDVLSIKDIESNKNCTKDSLPKLLKKTIVARFKFDSIFWVLNILTWFGICSTSVFYSAQPYFEV